MEWAPDLAEVRHADDFRAGIGATFTKVYANLAPAGWWYALLHGARLWERSRVARCEITALARPWRIAWEERTADSDGGSDSIERFDVRIEEGDAGSRVTVTWWRGGKVVERLDRWGFHADEAVQRRLRERPPRGVRRWILAKATGRTADELLVDLEQRRFSELMLPRRVKDELDAAVSGQVRRLVRLQVILDDGHAVGGLPRCSTRA